MSNKRIRIEETVNRVVLGRLESIPDGKSEIELHSTIRRVGKYVGRGGWVGSVRGA